MLCGRGQKKGKTALIFAVAVGWRWPAKGAGSEWERSARGCWGGHTSSSIPGPLPPCSACSAPRAGQTGGCLGKASPWLGKPAAVTCPAWDHPPVCSLQPGDLAGRCSSSLALAVTGTSGLGQHSSFLGMEGQQGQLPSRILALLPSTTSRDTAVAVGICRQKSPGVSQDTGRGVQGEPVPQPKHCPISTSSFSFPHCWHILPRPWGSSRRQGATLTLFNRGATAQRKGSETQTSFCPDA